MPRPNRIKFTDEDLRVLKLVRGIKTLGNASARMLLSAPVLELISSANPIEFAVTMADTDWNDIAGGVANIQKVTACNAQIVLDAHVNDGIPRPVGNALVYFNHLLDLCDRKCQA
ncbi:hypothetical protein [Hydrogenophaga sp.]|uniref:hypothetical protein n=1 Tax=Hydrogenophaga sp. TaxID=1904254 RepID=UPI0026120359|nr:hypothetical protein [Hydrogenophaga sp.]MDM7950374.1 hypothetical protein [Hydrogenophaga sp.]